MNIGKIVIAVDGYSACGKSSTAKGVAQVLGYRYIDTGAMYRAVTLFFLDHHITLTNPKEVAKALSQIEVTFQINSQQENNTYLNGLNVENKIRTMRVTEEVSHVSALREVRQVLVEQQRKLGKQKGVVMDGRDIGTTVFPNAELKVFMRADIMMRAYRRQQELLEQNQLVDLDVVVENLRKRDEIDSNRTESPLRQAYDAQIIDTTNLTLEEQIDEVVRLAFSRMVRT